MFHPTNFMESSRSLVSFILTSQVQVQLTVQETKEVEEHVNRKRKGKKISLFYMFGDIKSKTLLFGSTVSDDRGREF